MRVFCARPPEGVEIVVHADTESSRTLRALDGTPRAADWIAPKVTIATVDDRNQPLTRSSMPWKGGNTLVVRPEARVVVEELPGELELLALDCADDQLWIVNATRVLDDAIDHAESELERIPSGKVIAVRRPAFVRDVVSGVPIFRIAETRRSVVYVDERWANSLSVLDNVTFEQVWSDEPV